MAHPTPSFFPPAVAPGADADRKTRLKTLQMLALLIGVVCTALTPLVYLSTNNPPEVLAPAFIGLTGWVTLFLLRRGHDRFIPHTLVFAVLAAAILAVLAFGSVRTAAGFLFVAAVTAAGIFLGRAALFVTVVFCSVVLAALIWAERRGWLHTPDFQVGLTVWLTQTATLLVVAIMVYYSRTRVRQAFQRQMNELELRKRTEQERDRSMERFVRIFRTSPSPMLAQSARTGALLDVNPAFERCYGYTRDQVLGRSDAFLWADLQQRSAYLERLFSRRRTDQERVTGLRADGSHFEALISSEMGDDPQDRLIITTVADITAQDQAVERLRRSEERFAKAFNFSPLKMTITRLSDGTFLEVSRARDPVQGFRRTDLVGKTTLEVGGWLNPEDRQAFVERLQREGHLSGYETRMRHVDGRVIDARMWAELIEIDGEACVLSCFVNTTEEKRRETQLLTLTRGLTGPSGDALFQALTLHMAQAIGADMVTVGELLPGENVVRTLSVWRDGSVQPNFSFHLEGTPCGDAMQQTGLCVLTEGVTRCYPLDAPLVEGGFEAYVGQSLRDEDGSTIGLLNALWRRPFQLSDDARALIAIFASRATAELVRLRRDREILRLNASLEQRVRDRTAELEKLNAELDSFAYSVSHDLKSPLRAIDGFTLLLGEELGDRLRPHERVLFDRVLAATNRMSLLIADMLALARVSQGPLSREQTDLSALAERVMAIEQGKHPGRRLRWHITPGMVCHCDARLARTVLENLLGNAVKYTRDQAEPLIEFGRLTADGNPPGAFFVRDNGVGFNMHYADKLFKPFQRLHMPSEFEGAGIGLATVRRIVERHGGRIRGESAPGQGAVFHFTLAPGDVPLNTPLPPPTAPA